MDWDKAKPELQKKLDPKHIRPPAPGKFGEYLDGHHVISTANRIFGEDGWSYTIKRLEKVTEQTVELKNGPQYRVGYLATVVAEVGGVVREGAGFGSGMGKPDAMADHHESAVKEAETDALKRSLRTLGKALGLALYDKTRADIGVDKDPREYADRMIAAVNKAPTDEKYNAIVKHDAFQKNLDWLEGVKPPMAAEVRGAMSAKAGELARQITNQGAG